ncbi:MAG TPA: prolyl oligopeptidase family serine peptidase [Clostridiales bacterium]|nr:prolyl oligopeptidase family serine peptidase [Clostridiales bacterium]
MIKMKKIFVSLFFIFCCVFCVSCDNTEYILKVEIINDEDKIFVGDVTDYSVLVNPGNITVDYEFKSSDEDVFICESEKITAINKGSAYLEITAIYEKQVLEKKVPIIVNAYTTENINVVTGKYSLPGKLTVPDSETKVPAVVLIQGSGPLDMDSTINSIKLFKELAEGFARKGIASIRYDKRSFAYNQEMRLNFSATVNEEYINDCLSAIALLKNDDRIDDNNVFIIGHSLGANFAPVILNLDDSIKGAILLAGAPVHLLDLLLDQVIEINGQTVANQYEEEIMEGRHILEVTNERKFYQYMGAYEPYVVSYNKIDFVSEAQKAALSKKIFILQGGLDLQVYKKHFDLWKEYLGDNTNVDYEFYENLNHLFTDGQGETPSNAYKTYKPISIEVIKDISSWIINS